MTLQNDVPNTSLTLALEGDIPLSLFSLGMKHLNSLLEALTQNIATHAQIDWVIDDLEAGSAIATVTGESEDLSVVERVVEAYSLVGRALARGTPLAFPDSVEKEAVALTKLLNGRVQAIRFETPRQGFTVTERYLEGRESPQPVVSRGVLKGTVETISKRKRLSFTLYDSLFDKAVHCYLSPGQENMMRDIWGKKVAVHGLISRDARTGHPTAVRQIRKIEFTEEVEPGSYRRARGLFPIHDVSPSERIRRLRDA